VKGALSSDGGQVTKALLWRPRFALAALAILVLLFVLPLLFNLVLSFQENAANDPFAGPFGLADWSDFIGDRELQLLLLRSILSALLVGFAASLLAIAPAYLAAVIGGRWRQAVLTLSLTVLLGDQVTTVMGWSEIGRQLARWLIDADASSGRYALGDLMTFLAETHRALPLAILCQSWAMARHDPALIEAGLECGAHHGRLLRWVVWPVLLPGLLLGGLGGFAVSLGAALEPALLNSGAMAWGERLRQTLEIEGDWPQAAKLAVLAIIVLVLAVIATARLLALPGPRGRHGFPRGDFLLRGQGYALPRPFPYPLARFLRWQDPLTSVALLSLAFLALPLLWMLVLSLRYLAGIAITAGPRLFLQAIIDDPRLLPSVTPTLVAALIAALLAAGGGAGLAVIWRRMLAPGRVGWRSWMLLLLTAFPLLLPSLLLSTLHLAAHLFFAIYLQSGLGILAVASAEGLRAMPMAAVVMLIFWHRLPEDLDEITGEFTFDAERMRRQIIKPVLRPAWAIALAMAALLSIGEFQLANVLSGDRLMLSPSLLASIATQRSPIYLALIGPLLVLTAWICHLILRRLDRREQIRAPQGGAGGFGLSMNITARKT